MSQKMVVVANFRDNGIKRAFCIQLAGLRKFVMFAFPITKVSITRSGTTVAISIKKFTK